MPLAETAGIGYSARLFGISKSAADRHVRDNLTEASRGTTFDRIREQP